MPRYTKVIELHDKYLGYVSSCFANSSLFHKSLKEAFEAFCNKMVAGSTSAELMANFCDNLLKKVCLSACLPVCPRESICWLGAVLWVKGAAALGGGEGEGG